MPAEPRTAPAPCPLYVATIASRAIALSAVLLLPTACGPREDVTPMIAVQPGAAARGMLLLGKTGANEGRARNTKARVSTSADGSLVIENGEIAFGVADCAIVDGDEIAAVATTLGGERALECEATSSGAAPDGSSAWIETRGHEGHDRGLVIITRYTMKTGERALGIETTATNEGDRPVAGVVLGDEVSWRSATPVVSLAPEVCGQGSAARYVITPSEAPLDVVTDGVRTEIAEKAEATLGVGQSRRFARTVALEARSAAAADDGRLTFACVEPRGAWKALARVPCVATIEAASSDGGAAASVKNEVVAENGKIAIAIAPGTYRVTASHGPDFTNARFDVAIVPSKITWGPNEGAVVLGRIVDTHGYVATEVAPRGFVGTNAQAVAHVWASLVASGEVLDVWSADADARSRATADLLARLQAKAPVTAIASAATTYVRLDDDGSIASWGAAREADVTRGVRERRDVVLTNGPFLRVTANGASIGGVARPRARGGDVEVSIHVESATSVGDVRVSLARSTASSAPPAASQSVALRATPSGAHAADATFHVRPVVDEAFVVTAEIAPSSFAMTGAIWIDADGNGESLGRKADEVGDPPPEKPRADKTRKDGKSDKNDRPGKSGTP